jgi:integrase
MPSLETIFSKALTDSHPRYLADCSAVIHSAPRMLVNSFAVRDRLSAASVSARATPESALTSSTVTTIKAHRKRQNEERLAYAGLWEDHDLIFPDENGRPVRARNLNRHFQKLLKRANLEDLGLTFHGLRHTCATLMLLSDVPVKVVSERLGHADVALTLRVYSHVLPGMQKNAADSLNEMLF